jgi:hypothetical protein
MSATAALTASDQSSVLLRTPLLVSSTSWARAGFPSGRPESIKF